MPSVLADFRDEFELARHDWLRWRCVVWAGAWGGLWTVAVLLLPLLHQLPDALPDALRQRSAVLLAAGIFKALLFGITAAYVARARPAPTRRTIIRLVTALIIIYSIVQFVPAALIAAASTQMLRESDQVQFKGTIGVGIPLIVITLLMHLSASILVPWTTREALRAIAPFMLVYFAVLILEASTHGLDPAMLVATLSISALMLTPALLLPRIRQSRFARAFETRAVKARYTELSQELSTARRIHDKLFPPPITAGPVRLAYVYEPMRHIGGDFLFAFSAPRSSALSLVLIDVTGHGITAALSVNRLHGELTRIFGLTPDAPPGHILTELNRYLHFSLAEDSVFATALCLNIDPAARSITWASAGHPPALVRRASDPRALHTLDSTAIVLGAVPPEDFDPAPLSTHLEPGDAVLLYTDGAPETHTQSGRLLAQAGFEALALNSFPTASPHLTSPSPTHHTHEHWPAATLAAIKSLRVGPVTDDTLLVAAWIP